MILRIQGFKKKELSQNFPFQIKKNMVNTISVFQVKNIGRSKFYPFHKKTK